MPVVLSIDTSLASKEGVHLKWELSGLSTPLKEASLIMTKTGVSDSLTLLRLDPLQSTHSLLDLEVATEYVFILQVVDSSDAVEYSNTLSTLTRTTMTAPVIKSVYGIHDGLVVELETSSNTLGSSDKVEFVLRKNRTELFFIVKDFSVDRIYTLTAADNALLSNNNLYKVACMFQPLNNASSDLSTSVDAEPTNLPNIPRSLSISDPDEPDLTIDVAYIYPSDYDEWSDNFSVNLYYSQSSTAPLAEYEKLTFSRSVARSQDGEYRLSVNNSGTWYVKLSYTNRFGEGAVASTAITLKGNPDNYPNAPIITPGDRNILVYAPLGGLDDNGSVITEMKFAIIPEAEGEQTDEYQLPISEIGYYNLYVPNGYDYRVAVKAINSKGESQAWSPSSSVFSTKGEPTLALSSVVDKTINVSYSPNGVSLKSLQCIAIDTDPSSGELTEDSLIKTATVSDDRLGTQSYSFVFNHSSSIDKYIVISTSDEIVKFLTKLS